MSTNLHFKRAFFHELGHFVAHEIIQNNFGIHGIARIELLKKGIDHSGECIPIIPSGADPKTPLVSISERIVELIYGCYFQAIYIGNDFENCFNCHSNGSADIQSWAGILASYSKEKKEHIIELQSAYFKSLKANANFKKFFEIDFQDFLVDETNGNYSINVALLKERLMKNITEHSALVVELTNMIRNILS